MKTWQWQYQLPSSIDKSWRKGEEVASLGEAIDLASQYVELCNKYNRSINVRYVEIDKVYTVRF